MSTRGDILRRASQVESGAVPEPWGPSDDEEALATVSDREHYRKNLVTLPDGAGEVPAYVWDFPRTPTIPDEVREEWTRGSAGRVLGPDGKYVSRGSDVPRKSFDGEDPGLLVEAAGRTNYVQQSADATAWSKFALNTPLPTRGSILDGETAHLLDSSSVGEIKRFGGRAGTFSGNDETVGVILEESEQPVSRVALTNQSRGNFVGRIDLDWSKSTSNIVTFSDFDDENVRELASSGPNGNRIIEVRAYVSSGSAENVNGDNRSIKIRADKNANAKNIIFHHAQLEEATNASSPIVTGGSPVTRSADDYAIFENGQPPWWNPNAGTFLMSFSPQTFRVNTSTQILGEFLEARVFQLRSSSPPYEINILDGSSAKLQSAIPAFETSLVAASFDDQNIILSANGSSDSASSGGNIISATELSFGRFDKAIVDIESLIYFPRTLPESTLNAITS